MSQNIFAGKKIVFKDCMMGQFISKYFTAKYKEYFFALVNCWNRNRAWRRTSPKVDTLSLNTVNIAIYGLNLDDHRVYYKIFIPTDDAQTKYAIKAFIIHLFSSFFFYAEIWASTLNIFIAKANWLGNPWSMFIKIYLYLNYC